MTDYKLTREEQETTILGNAVSREWDICTADPKMIRRMERQGYHPDARPNPWGYVSFTIPLNKISILRAGKREYAPEALERKRAVITRIHNKLKSPDADREKTTYPQVSISR